MQASSFNGFRTGCNKTIAGCLKTIRRIIIPMICCLSGSDLIAQPQLTAVTDLGTSNVSYGLIIRTAGLAGFQYKNNILKQVSRQIY